jgi:hypothetical protein
MMPMTLDPRRLDPTLATGTIAFGIAGQQPSTLSVDVTVEEATWTRLT